MKISGSDTSFCFFTQESEFSGVRKIAQKVCNDVKLVTDFLPSVKILDGNGNENPVFPSCENAVIFGTVGKSSLLDCLGDKIELSKIKGKNESYSFSVIENPFENVKSALVIAGSDKRGTIYGLFHLSELIGVSPLVDWCNVMPAKKDFVEISEKDNFVSKEPSVRFRGFFINDEWPAFGNWSNHNFNGVNADCYEHVFELLLRLKGNYLWPAMWASRFSDEGPSLANAELADELGVIMGASHHEPCCRAGEEYRYLRGADSVYGDAWNFRSNEKGITKFWEDGLKRNGKFENVITVGMRGEADTAIMQNATLKDNIDLLRDVLKTQNRLIKEYVNPDLTKVPRMLALYKEVEPYFYGDKNTKGLMDDPELEGVTLMLCDDNHGNLRTVPTRKMRAHNGGYGMYYHFDYHGWPFSYEWINTTALPKVKEQMCAAYDFGIRDLWIVNVGDIFTTEFPLSYFLNLAYDYEKYGSPNYTTQEYTEEWVKAQFPNLSESQNADVNFILNNYTKLSHMRRTECILPDTYHPVNFGEGDRILSLAEKVISKAEKLKEEFPDDIGLFAQIIYPALGTMNVLRMQILSGKNKWLASKGCLAANDFADKVRAAVAYDKNLVDELDRIADGKFFAMGWSEHFGFKNWCEAENRYPTYTYVEPTRKKRIVVWIEGNEFSTTGQDWTVRTLKTDVFRNPDAEEISIFVGNTCLGGTPYEVSLKHADSFLSYRTENGILDKIVVSIDRKKLNLADEKTETLVIQGNDGHGAKILVNVLFDACVPSEISGNYPKGTYIQTTDYVSMEAIHFTSSQWQTISDYGKTLGAVKSYPVTAEYKNGKDAPFVQYDFVMEKEGVYAFDFYLNPSNPAYKDNKLQFVAEINGNKLLKDVVSPDFAVGDNQQPWGTDITNNIRISSVYDNCVKGKNVLKIYPVTPNVVVEKIVIHDANAKLPESYLGPEETYRLK